jgi:hypothetical protein
MCAGVHVASASPIYIFLNDDLIGEARVSSPFRRPVSGRFGSLPHVYVELSRTRQVYVKLSQTRQGTRLTMGIES